MSYSQTSFSCLRPYQNFFWGTAKKCDNRNLSFFISINYLKMLATGSVDKAFSFGIFINISKNGNEHETCLIKCAF